MKHSNINGENSIKGEIYSLERLEEYAKFLADQLKVCDLTKKFQTLLPRMRKNGRKLLEFYRILIEAIHKKEVMPPAAEWLTDNFHIVEEQLREIKQDLPRGFYKELPKLASGELAGYPRVYAIALALIAHTDSQLELKTLKGFVEAYQKISPLRIGELWAIAITLRLGLVENLRRITQRIVQDHRKRNRANQFADELQAAVPDNSKFKTMVAKLDVACGSQINEDCAYVAQLAKRLRDQEQSILPALESLERHLAKSNLSTEKVVNLAHQIQASNQVTVANIITSMRLLSGLNWRKFFESTSLVDRCLNQDLIYKQMDFLTRDHYRQVIERVRTKTNSPEIDIAQKLIDFTREHPDDKRQSHVGYYLIDAGLKKLEEHFHFRLKSTTLNLIASRPNFVYFGLLGTFLLAACCFPVSYALMREATPWLIFLILFFFVIPCSELAVNITNLVLTRSIRPLNLPKLDLSDGIPQTAKTMVVVPCMLSGSKVIQALLEKVEVHYLGNVDGSLSYGLLTDFSDSLTETAFDDEDKLKSVSDGIFKLNQKYKIKNLARSEDIFFLFHRCRKWNEQEKTWMGWERKRGKIHEFNHLLRGDESTSFDQVSAPVEFLKTIRFVITLDADTQLPRETARKLVGTILHPLNLPVFDKALGRVTKGYGILQPKIGISIESSNTSLFSKVFSGYTGIDPYTTAVSEIYQDLFQEGIYTGKGLYDVDIFNLALDNQIPENRVLSHDLLEGAYVRAALVTDIEFLDDYPQTYQAFFTRQHRWTRGDWQIASWIFSNIRNGKNEIVQNRLSAISRWKIFDNLRRSLISPFIFLSFIFSNSYFPGSSNIWIGFLSFIVVFPLFSQLTILTSTRILKSFSFRRAYSPVKIKASVMQLLLYILFLPHQAYIHADAVVRTLYRLIISKTKMLEWVTAAQVASQKSKNSVWQSFWPTEVLLFSSLALLIFLKYSNEKVFGSLAIYIVLIWLFYPFVTKFLSEPRIRKQQNMPLEDQLLLREIARRTWHYFEAFVGQDDNWLPPDNFQESPKAVIAHRTSPTNIGLYLLSLLSARDFGYVSTIDFVNRIGLSLATMKKLEQHEGHYFNWYDTKTLNALTPKYISTVDSGNLAGYLLTARQACLEIQKSLVVDATFLEGLKDTLGSITNEVDVALADRQDLKSSLLNFRKLLSAPLSNSFSDWAVLLRALSKFLEKTKESFEEVQKVSSSKNFDEVITRLDLGILQLQSIQSDILKVAPWATENLSDTNVDLKSSVVSLQKWTDAIQSIDRNVSLESLLVSYEGAIEKFQGLEASAPELKKLISYLSEAKSFVSRVLLDAQTSAATMDQIFQSMNFSFLLDQTRQVFSIGYIVGEAKFDSGLYDLLGSESRLASFIAIAKGDVAQEHWFQLGRQLVPTSSGRALISWTASMFEYLMPLLVMRDYENTLLEETMQTVVKRQISYGNLHHVPWGVSEAGYNARDLQLNYQYGPFGIPGLGLKRGLSQELVISPYSSLLAAMVRPKEALENIKRLIGQHLLSAYGFYESVDYTVQHLRENQKFAIIKSFMAHHQGMSLVAISNVIHNNLMQDRFHKDPRVQATRLLLQEPIPQGVAAILPAAAEAELESVTRESLSPLVRRYTDPNTPHLHFQLLSNRNYSILVSTSGSGYSKCGDLAVTRWQKDATRDNSGSFVFIRDHAARDVWSTTYQPTIRLPDSYKVSFGEDKVEFSRRDHQISTCTQILVAPEDDVEIRHVTLTNHSSQVRSLELTSYLEPVFAPMNNDLDHIAFSKLFIETEFLASKSAILATRRRQSNEEKESWGLHVVVSDAEIVSEVEYETDRTQFIGRGRNLANSIAMSEGRKLSNTAGATLDPIMSLRIKVRIEPNAKVEVAFTTGFASSRERALELADRYHDIHSFDREAKLAWTKSRVDMRHLDIDLDTAYLYQRLAERILYGDASFENKRYRSLSHASVQSSLWPSGISGDLPIVVMRIRDQRDMSSIKKLLRCHEYLRLKGFVFDFVILNEHESTYFQDLQNDIEQQIRVSGSQGWLGKSGGVFIIRSDITSEKDIAYIQSIARVALVADETLREQIGRKGIIEKYPSTGLFRKKDKIDKSPNLKIPDLDFFNGFGGFSKDGREYVIVLRDKRWTPAPWLNVIGNSRGFGFQVSESGSGFTWSINSQTNRLSPWSNDPVIDLPGEIIYLRDDDTGETWTPTPLPIRSQFPYVIRHGQGYTSFEHSDCGIEHRLTLFVPKDETIKISLLKLKNNSNRRRRISITSYTDWVLGSRREKTSPYVICDFDAESGAIFASNPHDAEFGARVSFADLSIVDRSFTCSRKEFLGRNGSYESPAALSRVGLSSKISTEQDPCAAIQTSIVLEAGEEREISILLGQCENIQEARSLTLKYRDLKNVREALKEVVNDWNMRIGRVQVKTPDPAMNILMNGWLLYQTLSCRYWSRTALYQSGGAYGFRDQLQDSMALVYSSPQITRDHILRCAAHQFVEGDVQHWWHPPTGRGIRTRISDDLLWLPFVVSYYVRITGDRSILDEKISFLEAALLKPQEVDSYTVPNIAQESASLFEHCIRAIKKSLTLGQHDLPLMGTGDWNDGMNHVGRLGQGESIWLGWFLSKVLADFLPFCNSLEQSSNREVFANHIEKLRHALEKEGWDGDWYKRAFFDDGSALGSSQNEECKIDSIAQTWAVLSGSANPERAKHSMAKVDELLIKKDSKLILLLQPPFDKTSKDPGYIKAYVPGVRENGGQYSHAAVWVMMAFAELGDGNKASELFKMLNPILHSQTELETKKYRIEPYVIAGDIYAGGALEGRGGWSWYTGSAAWYYRAGLESILGFHLSGNKLKIKPCIPSHWQSFEISYIYGKTVYFILVSNPNALCAGAITIELDGVKQQDSEINLIDDGKHHKIAIIIIEASMSLKSESAPDHFYNESSEL